MPRLTASALSGESVVTVAQRATIEAALDDAALSLVPDEDDLAHTEDFPIPNEATKARARGLASAIAQAGFDRGASSAIPRFGAAGDGGVGLHWRSVRLELLIIVPPDESKNASYYGETVTGSPIKGTLVADGPVGFLAQWLTENELSG